MPAKSLSPWPPSLPNPDLLAMDGEERREAGRLRFSEALVMLLRHVSHPQLSDLADWACGEPGTLHTSQISHMRNNKIRMLGTKAVDALGRVNQLVWLAKHHPKLLPQAGCGPMTPRIQRLVKAYQPVVHPESGQPLGAAEWMAVYLGYLWLPIEVPKELSLANAQRLEPLLLDWLEQEQTRQGLGFREVSRRLREAWSGEEGECKRLVRVLAGLEEYGAKHLSELWEVIGTALVAALGVEGDAWGLAERLLEGERGAEGVALGKGGGGVASAKSGGGSGKGVVAVATTGAVGKGKAVPTGKGSTATGKSTAVGKAGAAVSAGGKASPKAPAAGIAKAPSPAPAGKTKPRATTKATAKTSAVAKATTKATTKTSIKAKPPSKGSSPATVPGKGKASPTPRPARRRRATGQG